MNAVIQLDQDAGRFRLPNDTDWQEAFRREFSRIRSDYCLYPERSLSPSATLDCAAQAVHAVAAHCLPLGLAFVMHLYPLCALQCAPLPRLGVAGFKRRILVNFIRNRTLIVANGGSERVQGMGEPLQVKFAGDDVLVSGTHEYVSLASVADLVLFNTPLPDGRTVFCAASLQGDTVRIGESKFAGSMRLSDTRPVTFLDHRIARGRYLVVADGNGARCIFDYQRCWFHLLLADAYLARMEHLCRQWVLPDATDHLMAINELACMRQFALRLLDECRPHAPVDELARVTAAMKLRVSALAQSTSRRLHELKAHSDDRLAIDADAGELGYIRFQPTADDRILRTLAASTITPGMRTGTCPSAA